MIGSIKNSYNNVLSGCFMLHNPPVGSFPVLSTLRIGVSRENNGCLRDNARAVMNLVTLTRRCMAQSATALHRY